MKELIDQGMRMTQIEKRFLKDTQNKIKALAFKNSRSVCSIDDLHMVINLHPPGIDQEEA